MHVSVVLGLILGYDPLIANLVREFAVHVLVMKCACWDYKVLDHHPILIGNGK